MEKPAGYAVYAKVLEGWETEDLLDARLYLEELKSSAGWEIVERLLNQRREQTLALMVHGPIHSHEKYAAMAAEVSGLESALRAVDAVLFAADVRERGEQAFADSEAREGAIA